MHPSALRVAETLQALGVRGQVRQLPGPAPTAASAAAQLGCDAGAIAELIRITGGTPADVGAGPR